MHMKQALGRSTAFSGQILTGEPPRPVGPPGPLGPAGP